MDQGPPRDQATPYKREIIGEFVLQAPAVKKGRDGVDYTIPAGPQSIVGAVSLDGYKLHDAAIVYDPKLISQETGKPIYLPEPFHVPQLAEAEQKGLVQIHEPYRHKVDEAIALVQTPAKQQGVARHDERDLSPAISAQNARKSETNRHDERDIALASKASVKMKR
jgi:hypothetical protein